MIDYFLCLFLACAFYYLAYKTKKTASLPSIFVFLSFSLLVLFAGLRDVQVGTDTADYVNGFRNIAYAENLRYKFTSSTEIGFLIFQKIILIFSSKYYALLIGIAALSLAAVFKSIKTNSSLSYVSLFVYITLGYYTFFFNGARQGIAMSIYLLSFGALIRGDLLRYCFWVILAAFFHQTVLIALPVYFIVRRKFSVATVFLLIILSVAVYLSFNILISYGSTLENRYALFGTSNNNSSAGVLLTLFYFSLSVFFVMFRPFVAKKDQIKYDIFLNMMLLGSAVYIIVYLVHGYIELTRFAAYFQVASMFLWPYVFKNTSKKYIVVLSVSFIAVHLIFYFIFLEKIGDLTPYVFNKQLFI
jgi:hypothetical protein